MLKQSDFEWQFRPLIARMAMAFGVLCFSFVTMLIPVGFAFYYLESGLARIAIVTSVIACTIIFGVRSLRVEVAVGPGGLRVRNVLRTVELPSEEIVAYRWSRLVYSPFVGRRLAVQRSNQRWVPITVVTIDETPKAMSTVAPLLDYLDGLVGPPLVGTRRGRYRRVAIALPGVLMLAASAVALATGRWLLASIMFACSCFYIVVVALALLSRRRSQVSPRVSRSAGSDS